MTDREKQLEAALREALDDADEGWSYADEYFRDKWRDEEALAARRALVGHTDQHRLSPLPSTPQRTP